MNAYACINGTRLVVIRKEKLMYMNSVNFHNLYLQPILWGYGAPVSLLLLKVWNVKVVLFSFYYLGFVAYNVSRLTLSELDVYMV
jgi:hypothetical protein